MNYLRYIQFEYNFKDRKILSCAVYQGEERARGKSTCLWGKKDYTRYCHNFILFQSAYSR